MTTSQLIEILALVKQHQDRQELIQYLYLWAESQQELLY